MDSRPVGQPPVGARPSGVYPSGPDTALPGLVDRTHGGAAVRDGRLGPLQRTRSGLGQPGNGLLSNPVAVDADSLDRTKIAVAQGVDRANSAPPAVNSATLGGDFSGTLNGHPN